MTARALFRLPYSETYTVVEQTYGQPEELASMAALDGREGFVIAPFATTDGKPMLLLRPDRVETRPVEAETEVAERTLRTADEEERDRRSYAESFARCHAQLVGRRFDKLVLARRATERMARRVEAEQLFRRACRLYPRMFVTLVEAERCGTWLAATPEILLSGDGGRWRTMALAGTMRLSGSGLGFDCPPAPGGQVAGGPAWDDKNRREQRLVADYIEDALRPLVSYISRGEAHTVRAGDVVHLRSDFEFGLAKGIGVGAVAQALHPTPAVCGLPKADAYGFLQACEPSPRSYYSGFMGPLGIGGDTHLYVSLRCMSVCGDRCHLYAGGGLLADSVEEHEWLETEAKMETMRRVLGEAIDYSYQDRKPDV